MIELVFICEIAPNHVLDLWLNVGLTLVLIPICDLVTMH